MSPEEYRSPEINTPAPSADGQIVTESRDLSAYQEVMEISCDECGLCCSAGVQILLKRKDKKIMESLGTKLEVRAPKPNDTETIVHLSKREKKSLYIMPNGCAAYEPSKGCTVFGTTKRPGTCSKLPLGGFGCRMLRWQHGIDSSEKWNNWFKMTSPSK